MTASVTPLDPELLGLLQEAAWWRLLGRLFECPSPGWRADLQRLAPEVTDFDLHAAVAAALAEASEGQYHSVFGPGGPAPPREVSYHDTLELGSVMSSVAAYYHAFGYEPAMLESPDHVAVEIGFLAFLRFKQAFAIADGEEERASIAAEAAEMFRLEHLAAMSERLGALLAHAPLLYLQAAGRLLAARVGPRPGPMRLPVITRPLDDEGSEFSCEVH